MRYFNNWLLEMMPEELVHIDPYLSNHTDNSNQHGHQFRLPEVIGILPIRNAVCFPGTVTPLAVGREHSKRLIEDMRPKDAVIGLVTQLDPEIDEPGPGTFIK